MFANQFETNPTMPFTHGRSFYGLKEDSTSHFKLNPRAGREEDAARELTQEFFARWLAAHGFHCFLTSTATASPRLLRQ